MGFLPKAWASQLPPELVAFIATQLTTEAVQTMLYPTRHSHLSFLSKHHPLFKQFTLRPLEQLGFQWGFAGNDFEAALQLVGACAGSSLRRPARTGPDQLQSGLARVHAGRRAQRRAVASGIRAELAALRDRLCLGDVYVATSHRYANLGWSSRGGQ